MADTVILEPCPLPPKGRLLVAAMPHLILFLVFCVVGLMIGCAIL
jgi:hypothetical protein